MTEAATSLDVAIIGAGAVGALVAASAAAGGHRVTLCTRTPFDHLVVVRDGEEHSVNATVVTAPEDLAGAADVVAVTVKAQDTAGAEAWLRRLCGPDTVVVALQNGLDHQGRLAPLVPHGSAIVPGLVYIATERTGPGRVVHHSGRGVELPAELPAELSPPNGTIPSPAGTPGRHSPVALATAALGPDLDVSVVDDWTTAVWRKLLSNVVANPVTALTMRRIDVMADPAIIGLATGLLHEAVATARAAGAELDSGDADGVLRLYRRYQADGTSGSSMFYDRLAGQPLEHEALTGALVAVAHRHGIAVPLNEALLALLRVIDPAAELRERTGAGGATRNG